MLFGTAAVAAVASGVLWLVGDEPEEGATASLAPAVLPGGLGLVLTTR